MYAGHEACAAALHGLLWKAIEQSVTVGVNSRS